MRLRKSGKSGSVIRAVIGATSKPAFRKDAKNPDVSPSFLFSFWGSPR